MPVWRALLETRQNKPLFFTHPFDDSDSASKLMNTNICFVSYFPYHNRGKSCIRTFVYVGVSSLLVSPVCVAVNKV
jgi:hypothetical protein